MDFNEITDTELEVNPFFCRVCGHTDHIFDEQTNLFFCHNCGVVFTNPANFSTPKVRYTKLSGVAIDPIKQLDGDAAWDLSATNDYVLRPGETKLFKTDLAFELPQDIEIQIRSRSGLANKSHVHVLNAPGTIDSGYRGNIGVILHNASQIEYTVNIGDRIAQMLFAVKPNYNIECVNKISTQTDRSDKGYGHTGN